MGRRTTTCGFLILLLTVMPAVAGLKVYVDHDEFYDFSSCKTYVWEPGIPAPNELMETRIFDGVDDALQASGLTPAEDLDADLIVVTEVAGDTQMKASNVSVGVGVGGMTRYGAVGVGASTPVGVSQVTKGTLVIAVLDGKTGQLVWRAKASDTITDNQDRTKSIIDKAIQKAFKKFPPGKK